MVGSLCVVRKIFPYVNMCVDHVMPCRIRRYASPLVGVIRQSSGEMHPSASSGPIYIIVDILTGVGNRVLDSY